MSTQKKKLTKLEIERAFGNLPPVLSPQQLASLLGQSVKTIYGWLAAGRLDGTFRRRGKHCLILRDRVIDVLFNGPMW